MAFGLSACGRVDTRMTDISTPKAETLRTEKNSPQTPRPEMQSASDDPQTFTEEEEEFYFKQQDAWKELVEGLDIDTVGKPKNYLVTPHGVKAVYDPYQDPVVKTVFKKLYEERQGSDYFDDWPETLIERSQKTKARDHQYFGTSDISFIPTKILGKARSAQQNDYARAGCRGIEQLNCLDSNVSIRRFRPCSSESGVAWGSSVLSECEYHSIPRRPGEEDEIPLSKWPIPGVPKLCHYDEDLPSISRPDGYTDRYLPFHVKQIGDPMRGTVEQQFDQYFAISCSKYITPPKAISE